MNCSQHAQHESVSFLDTASHRCQTSALAWRWRNSWKSFSARLLFTLAAIGSAVFSVDQALASDCDLTFYSTTTSNRHLLNRLSVSPRELSEYEKTLPPELQPGGHLRFSEKPLSADAQTSLIEFVGMLAANRQKTFSVKDFDRGGSADTGTFTLGIPLVGKYSVEATYTADFRHGEQYNLSNLKLVPPFGKPLNISSNPLTPDGKINPRIGFDLSMHPDLAKYDLIANLPATVDMASLAKVEATKNQLNFVEKPEMRAIAMSDGYMKLRWLMLQRFVKAKMIEYHVKGIFKRYVALVSAPVVIYLVYVLLPDGTFSSVKEFFTNPDPFLVDKALTEFANGSHVPDPIRDQVDLLRHEVLTTLDPTGARSRQLTREQTLELDASSRFDIAKGQSAWIQTMQDPKTREITSVLFLSRFNGSNQIEISAVPLDRKRYQPLISFIESRGDFMPQSREELKR